MVVYNDIIWLKLLDMHRHIVANEMLMVIMPLVRTFGQYTT